MSKRRILMKKGDFISKKESLKDKKREYFDWNERKKGGKINNFNYVTHWYRGVYPHNNIIRHKDVG